jgi:hypothetical protein
MVTIQAFLTAHDQWWTFAGGGANPLLASMFEADFGEKVTGGNTSVRFKERAGDSLVAVRQAIDAIAERGRPTAKRRGAICDRRDAGAAIEAGGDAGKADRRGRAGRGGGDSGHAQRRIVSSRHEEGSAT